ncbi:tripartite tricarboxylate transporter TctB family protein [Aeromicrobium sp. CF4.19]|uniref:tripartite tricarboxylate transporter TctB family protein n=1 Tax=Aeromicrobium sp. CF4.19 TaxID=3373082 RepID=UPI003EE7441F
MASTSAADASQRTLPVGELVFAGGVIALGLFTVVRAGAIVQPVSAGSLGPQALPYVVGIALLLCGAAVGIGVLRGQRGVAEDGEDVDADDSTDWRTVGLLIALFLAHVLLILPIGWPLAATVLFGGSAVILGARPWWRAAAIGLVLALVLQLAFAGGLGVSLPAGPLLEGVPVLGG